MVEVDRHGPDCSAERLAPIRRCPRKGLDYPQASELRPSRRTPRASHLPLFVTVAAFAAILVPASMAGAEAEVSGSMTVREDVLPRPRCRHRVRIVGQNAATRPAASFASSGSTTPRRPSRSPSRTTPPRSTPGELRHLRVDHRRLDGIPDVRAGARHHRRPHERRGPRRDRGGPGRRRCRDRHDRDPGNTSLSSSAVAVAALVDETTGTTVARQVIATPGNSPIAFSIAVDQGVIDPTDTYVAKAGVVDGSKLWAAWTACRPSRTASS